MFSLRANFICRCRNNNLRCVLSFSSPRLCRGSVRQNVKTFSSQRRLEYDRNNAFLSGCVLWYASGSETRPLSLGRTKPEHLDSPNPEPTVTEKSERSILLLKDTPLPYHDISEANLATACEELEALLGHDAVNKNFADRKNATSTEWSPATADMIYPAFIVYPSSTSDVSEICKICSRRRIPITGYSGGTSLEGALATMEGGIVIDFRRMNKILTINQRDLDAVVQPGVGWQELNEELAPINLFFPPDPGPGAQIGGMISTSCSGTNAYRYGTMKDWVISVTVVLADGTVVKTRHRPRKSSAGYDLTRLFVGSGGTLGLITEAVVKLTAKPENLQVAVAAFPTEQHAVDLATKIVQRGLQLAAMELLDDTTMRGVNQSGYVNGDLPEKPTLFLKFTGTPNGVREDLDSVEQWAREGGCTDFKRSSTSEEVDTLWAARKVALWSFIGMKRNPDDEFRSVDIAVPISRLAQLVTDTKTMFNEAGLISHALGHVGDGNVHLSALYSEAEREKAESILSKAQNRAIELEGTITGEHGIGYTYRDALETELGPETVGLMRQLKYAMDPLCILNCNKVIRMKT